MKLKYKSKCYQLISSYYGDQTTKRSGVRLMNHIDEGVKILIQKGCFDDTINAYCLHPLVQADEDLEFNYPLLKDLPLKIIILVMEYRRIANSYLSTMTMDKFVGFTDHHLSIQVRYMLYADKIQNEKDFRLYHEATHPRSKELREYFDNWLNIILKDV